MAKRNTLEEGLGVKFKNPALLQQALLHSSYVNENPDAAPASNERLEFLGDAVLGLVVANDLYASYPDQDEGTLTELRTHLVRRDTLAEAARELSLGAELRLGHGEAAGGGAERPTNLSNAYEAVVGAIFLDSGLSSARDFIRRTLEERFRATTEQTLPPDFKSRLQEFGQSQFQSTPVYRVVQIEGPDHARTFTVEVSLGERMLGSGKGSSKQQAEKEAAREALKELDESSGGSTTGMSIKCT